MTADVDDDELVTMPSAAVAAAAAAAAPTGPLICKCCRKVAISSWLATKVGDVPESTSAMPIAAKTAQTVATSMLRPAIVLLPVDFTPTSLHVSCKAALISFSVMGPSHKHSSTVRTRNMHAADGSFTSDSLLRVSYNHWFRSTARRNPSAGSQSGLMASILAANLSISAFTTSNSFFADCSSKAG